uniref:Outer dense fiber protein 3-like n=1 Tax=Crassostrea virginica TaxID=6565 RepID=A0A8B8CVX0_CRAVI|nr:outer dense fiber protein 3-like [Crassostrea virginica]XP_022320018.1 outer dense fiber protein 3-like [Crassostrea virginica]XP_022320020.1 outer dense fiber protein 3-like [Crassostrea virginica]
MKPTPHPGPLAPKPNRIKMVEEDFLGEVLVSRPHLYQQKTDFFSDNSWPTPSSYTQRPLLGPRQRTTLEAPSFSIGVRRKFDLAKPESTKQPSPVDYEKNQADKVVYRSSPCFSHQFRREGTILWSHNEKTPGPAAYSPRVEQSKLMRPASPSGAYGGKSPTYWGHFLLSKLPEVTKSTCL